MSQSLITQIHKDQTEIWSEEHCSNITARLSREQMTPYRLAIFFFNLHEVLEEICPNVI